MWGANFFNDGSEAVDEALSDVPPLLSRDIMLSQVSDLERRDLRDYPTFRNGLWNA